MSKILQLGLVASLVGHMATAQVSIPNNDLENWETPPFPMTFEQPVGWYTSNGLVSLQSSSSKVPVTKSGDKFSGSFAMQVKNVKIENINGTGKDSTIKGYASLEVDVTNKELPAFLIGKVKYTTKPYERVMIGFGYKEKFAEGEGPEGIISRTRFLGYSLFEGTSNGFIHFSIPTTLYSFFSDVQKTNTLEVVVNSCYTYGNEFAPVSEDTYLIVDSLDFKGIAKDPFVELGPTIINGNFNEWVEGNNGSTLPKGWYSILPLEIYGASGAIKSTDAISSPYALGLENDSVSRPTGLFTLFKPTRAQKFVNFSSKYRLDKQDTVVVALFKVNGGNLSGELLDSMIIKGTQNTYKPFTLSFNGKVSGNDTLAFLIMRLNKKPQSYYGDEPDGRSPFLIDDVSVSSIATDLDKDNLSSSSLHAYPNPSANGLFTLYSAADSKVLRVSDALGNVVASSQRLEGGQNVVDLSQQPKGIYFVTLSTKSGEQVLKLMY